MTAGGTTLPLADDDLVVSDVRGPIALAGLVDDDRVAVREGTQRVLLTCATFEPSGIARTAKRLGVETEAGLRFSRGVDPTNAPEVLAQTGALLTRVAGAAAVPGSFHAMKERWSPRQVHVRREALPEEQSAEAHEILTRLGFGTIPLHGQRDALLVSIPGFRPEVRNEQDVLDEVARIRRAWLADAVKA
jgi:phenylalanyl-tRNA synthetase beta chain